MIDEATPPDGADALAGAAYHRAVRGLSSGARTLLPGLAEVARGVGALGLEGRCEGGLGERGLALGSPSLRPSRSRWLAVMRVAAGAAATAAIAASSAAAASASCSAAVAVAEGRRCRGGVRDAFFSAGIALSPARLAPSFFPSLACSSCSSRTCHIRKAGEG